MLVNRKSCIHTSNNVELKKVKDLKNGFLKIKATLNNKRKFMALAMKTPYGYAFYYKDGERPNVKNLEDILEKKIHLFSI